MAATRNSPSAELLSRLEAQLRAHLPVGADLWVGLSGGRDSVVLLQLCKTLLPAGQLRAVHVHHGLSPNADAWADFCTRLCAEWDIPLQVIRVQVPRQDGRGLEAAAREARYQAYRACGARYLALAHHRRDQAETLLFNLCRGAGVSGGAAMPACRSHAELTLLRPLLETGGSTVNAYAEQQGLVWIEDESNQDETYTRNFLRRQVLPLLETRFPAAEVTLARAAGHFAEAEGLLNELAAQDDALIQARVMPLLQLSEARQANWLRYWLRQRGWQVPEAAALTEALRQIRVTPADGLFELRLPEGSLRLWRGALYRVPVHLPLPLEPLPWQGEAVLAWGSGLLRLEPVTGEGIALARLAGRRLTLQARQGGESLVPGAGRPRRPLKKLLQEAALPPWERELLPLIYVDKELVACPGLAVAADWQCAPGEAGLLPRWGRD